MSEVTIATCGSLESKIGTNCQEAMVHLIKGKIFSMKKVFDFPVAKLVLALGCPIDSQRQPNLT